MRDWWNALGLGTRAMLAVFVVAVAGASAESFIRAQRPHFPKIAVSVQYRAFVAIEESRCLEAIAQGTLAPPDGADKDEFCQWRAAAKAQCKAGGPCSD